MNTSKINIRMEELNAEIEMYTNSGYVECEKKEAKRKVIFKDKTLKTQKTIYFK